MAQRSDRPPRDASHELLARELEANEVMPLPPDAYDELAYAPAPPVHEGRSPTYGAVVSAFDQVVPPPVVDEPSGLVRSKPLAEFVVPTPHADIPLPEAREGDARPLADGRACFVFRGPSGARLVRFDRDVSDDDSLASIAIRTGGGGVRRDERGVVRVVNHQFIHYHRDRRWTMKQHVDGGVSWPLELDAARRAVAFAALRFAHYQLSTHGIGATLVWLLDHAALARRVAAHGKAARDVRWAELSVARQSDWPTLAHLLSQTDGASLVAPDGGVVAICVQLGVERSTVDIVPEGAGLRHTSARGFSFDEPECCVVVVSADGPVSTCVDGVLADADAKLGTPVRNGGAFVVRPRARRISV